MTTRHANGKAAAGARLGHVALGVSDLKRAASFYRDLIGLEVTAWGPG
jgi:catechol-2,3-dioxygenase